MNAKPARKPRPDLKAQREAVAALLVQTGDLASMFAPVQQAESSITATLYNRLWAVRDNVERLRAAGRLA